MIDSGLGSIGISNILNVRLRKSIRLDLVRFGTLQVYDRPNKYNARAITLYFRYSLADEHFELGNCVATDSD